MEVTTLHQNSPLPETWVEKIFDRMLLSFGKKFIDQWAGADPQKLLNHWTIELAGFTGAEIKSGLTAMDSMDWPPNLPQFKKLCRPDADPMKAYYEALAGVQARAAGQMGVWSHPAIYWAAMPLSFDLGSQSYSQIKGRWEQAFSEQMDRGEWAQIPEPMLALPEPGKGKLSREGAAKMMEELGADGVLKSTSDHLRWAKRIMERVKRKDRTLEMIQVRFAKEALGIDV